jgi:hypothetical protein
MGPSTAQGEQPMMGGADMARMMAMMHSMHGRMPMGSGGMGAMGMGPGGFGHIEGQIAFLKAELAITDAQAPQWNAFAEVLRDQAAQVRQTAAQTTPAAGVVSAPEQMERRIAMLTTRTEAMRAMVAVTKPLYEVLTDDQKKTGDALIAEHFMMMGRGRP